MIRVVHVVVAGELGGAERMLVDLASRPDQTGAEHAVALFTPNDALRGLLRDAGLRIHDRGPVREGPLPFLWQALGPGELAWLTQVLRQEKARVVHLHTFASQVLGTRAALRAGARIVRTEHSTRVYDDLSCWPFSRWSLARADASVAVSRHVRTVALSRAPWVADKMRVITNGVDTDHFQPRDVAKAGVFTFAFVGRLERRKGIDLALQALAGVPTVRLEVVGDGVERAALEKKARALGIGDRVRFHGYVDDTRAILATARAALCTSRTEGLGLALLEAMSMAVPVVGFAVGGVPEIVRDGETGLLCRPGDVASLTVAMLAASKAGESLGVMGATAREDVVKRFSVSAMCSEYAAVYAAMA